MGDAQSAQREGKKDAAPDEESGKVDDAQTEQNAEDEPLKKHGQISEINGKSDGSVAEVNGHCEDEIAAEAIPPPDEDFLEREKQVKDEDTPVNVEINEKKSPIGANEDVPKEMIEIDAKQNDINESFRRFFSNIGLKLTVKRGSGEIATDVPDETNKEEPNRPEDVENISKETTNVTSEDVLQTAEEKTTETKEEVESDNVDKAMTSPVGEDAHQDATPQEVPHSTSPSSPEEEVVMSPLKRFFTTGIFSGLQKKKKPTEVVTIDKELADMGVKEVKVAKEQPEQDQQQDKEDISLGVEAATVETVQKENDLEMEIVPEASAETINASTVEPSTIIVTEPEILDSQEKDKVQASPLKRLLSGSSLKKLSKRQRSRRSSDAKLSDSGEHVLDQYLSSTESAENQKEETCAQSSADAAAEEDGAWASFKKLMTPKKRMKRSSLTNEETRIPGSVEPSEGGQISDHSTEEGKKRKDSSVSWESVLCGSGRRRSRKTSDSEEETPQTEANKQDGGSKNGAELALESSNEADDIIAYSPKQAGSPSDSDGGSTWKSLKKLVTPKRKVKDEDESKDNVQSDSEVPHDESSFSIKKLLPGRKKWKSAEKQDQVSSDEADKDVASGDEDSETPAVVPLSEFDTVEMEVHIQTQADVESHIPTEAAYELQQDLLDQIAKPVLPCDTLQTEAKEVQDNDDALENQAFKTPSTKEEPDDLTESISKPQLSDIPEEATPASATEEAARDDTIAEDLIEITSEVFTAPEPLDITQADETEMISAVSQLSSESSKTSGNTTPVPAEYDFLDTEVLLNQVVDNISVRPKAVPVCSDELRSERIVVSVSHQILETFVKEEPTIQETQRGLDATTINTVLNVQEVIAIDELAATTQTDSISEVIDSISTEIASEVLTEDFDTAEIAIDEIHEVNVAHQEDSLKELESIDEYHHVVECLSEVNTAVSTDILPEGDETFPDNGSLVATHQAETEPPKTDSQEADSAATVAEETKDGAKGQEVPTLTEKEDQIMHKITKQIQIEDKDQPPVVKALQELAAVQAAPLDSEESCVQSLEKDIISENIPAAETVAYELKEEMVLTEVNAGPEKRDEMETDASKTVRVQEPEVLQAVQAATLDSEEGSVQSPEEGIKSENISVVETVTEEPQEETIFHTEVKLEPTDASKPEHAQEPEVLQAVQAATFDSEDGSVQLLEKDVISEDRPVIETFSYKLKGETVLSKVSVKPEKEDALKTDAAKPEHVQAPEVVQASTLDSEEVCAQSPKEEVKSEDNAPAETVTDEAKQTADSLTEVTVKSPPSDSEESSVRSLEKDVISVDIPVAETVTYKFKGETVLAGVNVEPENEDERENDIAKPEHVQVPEASEPLQASTVDSEESSVQTPEGEVKSKDIPTTETVTDEPKQTAENLSDVEPQNEELSVNAIETVQEPEAPESVQASTDSEEGNVQSLQKDIISVNVPTAETDTYKLKEETVQTEVNVEPEKEDELERDTAKPEHVQVPEASEPLQAPSLDSEEGSGQSPEEEVKSEDISSSETLICELKKDTVSLTEVNVESEKEAELETDAAKPEQVQVPEAPEAVQASTLDSEQGSIQSPEQKTKSEDIPRAAPVTDEAKQTAEHLTAITLKPENKELPVNAVKTVQEQEVSEAIHATTDSEGNNVQLQPQVISEDIPEAKTTDENELKKETILLTIVNREPLDADKTKHVQVTEASEAVTASTLGSEEGSVQSPEEKVKFEDISKVETITNESKEGKMPFTEANLEPVDADKSEHVHVPEAWRAVQASTLDSKESSVQSPEEEAEPITDEPKQTEKHLTEGTVDPEDKELLVNAVKTPQEPEALESVQAPKDSEEDSVQPFEKDVIIEDAPEAKTITDEPKKEAIPLAEFKLEVVHASKTDQAQEPEVIQTIQAATLDSVEGDVQLLEKEVFSEDILVVDAVSDEPKQETEVKVEPEEKLPVEAAKAEHVQEPKVLQAVQVASLDSEAGSLLPIENEVTSEDGSTVETVTEEPKQETEMMTELEEKLPVEATKMEHVQEPEVLQTIQAVTLESEVGNLLPLEQHVISRHILAVEKVTEEPKQENEVRIEPEEKILVEASEMEHVQEPEALQAVQAVTLASEVCSLLPFEKEVTLEDIPAVESVTDEPKQEMVPLTEVKLEAVDTSKTENVQEPEVLQAVEAPTSDSKAGSLLSLEKEVISEEIPAVETATDEPRQETELRVEAEEKLQTAAAKTEHVQEPETLSSDNATETKTEEGASMYGHTVTENVEGGEAQELGKQILSDFPNPDADNIIASVTDDIKVVAQLGLSLEIKEDQKTESISQDFEAEKEDGIPKVIDELQALTAVCLSVNEDAGHVHVLEKTVFTKETPTPCVDNAAITNEPKHEVHLSAVQVTDIKSTADEHAVVALTVPCNFKDVSAAIPDVLIEETAAITEPLIDTVTSELMFKEGVEATTPLVKDAVAETAEESSVVVMMHVPSVFEDNHTIEVKVVDADIKSAETIVDTVLEAGVTEDKEVIDVCHVMVTKVDNLSATPKLEKELTNEENKVTIQEVIQHVMEHLPGTVPESVVVNLEERSITQQDAVTEVSEMVESESNEMEDQKVMEDSMVTFRERQDEDLAVISNDSGQKVSEDIMQTPGGLEVFIHDHKDNSEETKVEWEKSEADVTAEEVRSSSEELHVKEINQQAQITQIDPSLNVTPSDTGLAVPQNTGIISSISNVESPSSQVKSPTSLPSTTEGKGPEKKTEVSEFTVQAVEPVNPTRVKSQEQTELTEITLQTTEITEPATNLDSMERNVITTQHVLLDVEVTETVELVEHIKSTERVTSRVQVTETIQSLQQTEQREVFLSQQVLSEVGDVETRAEEPVTQREEENDQDVWMDAEEDIYTQQETEVSLHRVEESPELRTEREQERLDYEFEMAPTSKTEEKESQQEMYKTAETCEIDSEGEDFAVALEHPEAETANITTME
ncbi:titin homolog isoform X2 [Epinephelus fuscoguttatus]|uniref:titin homolog isoform X2 n=1 Tax=Epinephelus fuscoguttatus TaxID=293821 RepID=UPI0020D0593D|nr:titin homolog isoform X2 [Epinephelus fuscoguttatus]